MNSNRVGRRLVAALWPLLLAASALAAHAGIEPTLPAAPGGDRSWADQTAQLMAQAAADAGGALGRAPALGSSLFDQTQGSEADAVSRELAAAGIGTPALWALITATRAQQRGAGFFSLESNLHAAQALQPAAVGAVPLPPAGWLLPLGLVGLFGMSRGLSARPNGRSGAAR